MPGPDEPRLVQWAGKPTWQIYWRRTRTSTGARIDAGKLGRAQAEAALAKFKAGLNRPDPGEPVSVELILERYVADREARGKPGADRLKWSSKQLVRHIGPIFPEDVDVLEYIEKRMAEGVKSRTVRTELETLRASFNWAVELKHPLLAKAPKVELPPKGEGRLRWLTRDEADRLIAGCVGRHVKLFVLLGLHTAARMKAILDLTWDQVDLEHRLIDYRKPDEVHTKKRRSPVPINETLSVALTEAKERAESDWVIEHGGGGVSSIRHGFEFACERAGLKDVTPHVLRHTAVTWMLQRGVSPWDVCGMADLTLDTVQRVYAHHHPDFLRKAADSLAE